jgi:hypothetical protein
VKYWELSGQRGLLEQWKETPEFISYVASNPNFPIHMFGFCKRHEKYSAAVNWIELALFIRPTSRFPVKQVLRSLLESNGCMEAITKVVTHWFTRWPSNRSICKLLGSVYAHSGKSRELAHLVQQHEAQMTRWTREYFESLSSVKGGVHGSGRTQKFYRKLIDNPDYCFESYLNDLHPKARKRTRRLIEWRRSKKPKRAIVEDFNQDAEYRLAKARGANKLLVVFAGASHNLLGLPIDLIDCYFAELSLDVLYIADRDRQFSLNGVRGLGSTVEEATASIQKLQESRDVYIFATSAGSLLLRGHYRH